MALGASGTVDVSKNYKWSAIKRHAEHDPNINHSNKYIEFENTKYNSQGQLLNYDELMTARYSDYVKEHDAKMIKSSHTKDVYGSVDNYLSKMKTQPYLTMVATFGDMDLKNKIASYADSNDIPLKIYNQALVDYVNGFNERNKELKITEYITNVDEKGAPHVHAQIVPMGMTKKGKPSTSLNSALNSQYGTRDSREALRLFRAQEDNAIIDSFNKFFEMDNDKAFLLHRTGKQGGAPMEEYKKAEVLLKKRNDELNQKNIQLFNINRKIDIQKNQLDHNEQKLESIKDIDNYVAESITQSYDNLKKHKIIKSENLTPELIPMIAKREKSYNIEDDKVINGSGDNETTFSGFSLVVKFQQMYESFILKVNDGLKERKRQTEEFIEKSKRKIEDKLKSINKEKEPTPKLPRLSKTRHNMDEDLGLNKGQSKGVNSTYKIKAPDFTPKPNRSNQPRRNPGLFGR